MCALRLIKHFILVFASFSHLIILHLPESTLSVCLEPSDLIEVHVIEESFRDVKEHLTFHETVAWQSKEHFCQLLQLMLPALTLIQPAR